MHTPAFTQIIRLGELFLEVSYRKVVPVSEKEVEIKYQYGRECVAEQLLKIQQDSSLGHWIIAESN